MNIRVSNDEHVSVWFRIWYSTTSGAMRDVVLRDCVCPKLRYVVLRDCVCHERLRRGRAALDVPRPYFRSVYCDRGIDLSRL